MIPWFISRIIGVIVRPFGFHVHALARIGDFGFRRLYIVRDGQEIEVQL